ncbi:MAG: response regulator [Myxococcales bacterium]|nr:response regulator [Myxococcales bacterium]MCB9749820.1 response regulator [Myxococcales bacterium]
MNAILDNAVLLADDDEMSRSLGKRLIEGLGLRAIVAGDGYDALRMFHRHRMRIALLLLDVCMPKLGGPELLAALRRIDPQVPALLTSGVDADVLGPLVSDAAYTAFVPKPWRIEQLEREIRLGLAQRPSLAARRHIGRTRLRAEGA